MATTTKAMARYRKLERAAEAMQLRPTATSEDIREAWKAAEAAWEKVKAAKRKK